MSEELEVFNLIDKTQKDTINKFSRSVTSTLKVHSEYEGIVDDSEWIDKMEETIQYLDNIFRAPNRFIVNEEEVVKIELARKITVDSIKHLSKNTNLIQEIDKKNGDVKPSKILNINKEESYDTYENRFIYTLIQQMKIFIARRKKSISARQRSAKKDNKHLEYNGESKINNEKININMELFKSLNSDDSEREKERILDRIGNLEKKLLDITSSEVYKILDKKHVALVTSPIKKTNVILKNVNFQYAVKLWNYLQENFDDKTEEINKKNDYEDNGSLKKMMDESFLVDYLIINTLEQKENEISDNIDEIAQEKQEQQQNMLKTNLTENMLERIISLNSDLTEEQLQEMVSEKFQKIKYRNLVTIKEIHKIFRKHIVKYLEQINK